MQEKNSKKTDFSKQKNGLSSSYLDEHDVAEMLNLSVNTLRAWRQQKKNIPFLKLGLRAVRYRESDIHEFMDKNLQKVH